MLAPFDVTAPIGEVVIVVPERGVGGPTTIEMGVANTFPADFLVESTLGTGEMVTVLEPGNVATTPPGDACLERMDSVEGVVGTDAEEVGVSKPLIGLEEPVLFLSVFCIFCLV